MASTQRVLVIDDEPDVGKFISSAAQTLGLHCDATTDVTAFLKELTPDTSLIFLDLMMPQTDGIEVLRLLSQQECRVPIVLMSGVGNRVLETAEQLAQSLGLSIIGHLNKPFRLKEVQSLLTKSVASKMSPEAKPQMKDRVEDEALRKAVEQNEFVLHYQPQIEIATCNVIGVEALVRWNHPEHGLIYPDYFIRRTEELGLIDQLGWIVYDRGMREVGHFADEHGVAPMLSLNVSLQSLKDLNFPDRFVSLIEQNGMSARNVTVEITESGLMEELSKTLDVLTRLRIRQVSLSIDDFGTGYAMMQHLRSVPATELKIDKSFVQNLHRNDRDRIIAQKTIEIGHEFGMKVVAEGVETQEQVDFLCANHCDVLQGYLFSRPLPAKDLVNWLGHYRSRQTDPGASAL